MAGINISDAGPTAWIVSGNAFRFLLGAARKRLDGSDPLAARLDVAMEDGWLDIAQPNDAETRRLMLLIQDVSVRLVEELKQGGSEYEGQLRVLLEQLISQLKGRFDRNDYPA